MKNHLQITLDKFRKLQMTSKIFRCLQKCHVALYEYSMKAIQQTSDGFRKLQKDSENFRKLQITSDKIVNTGLLLNEVI